MKKVVIYGASNGGKNTLKYLKKLEEDFDFVCFVDGDAAKHGSSIQGLEVKAPEDLPNLDFDLVFIGSSYVDEIWTKLQELDVPSDKVEPLDYTILNGPTKPWGCIILASIAFAAIIYYFLR